MGGEEMGDTEFSTERLLEQASGNQTAIFLMALRWAKEREGSVDSWATFMGEQFAPGWGSEEGAREVARNAGLNFACGAESEFAALEGDASRAEAVIEGPDAQWLEDTGVSQQDYDRANELIFGRIAEHLGLSFAARRSGAGFHLMFSREPAS
jgi:hypothetical protein